MKINIETFVEKHKASPRSQPLIKARIVGPKIVRFDSSDVIEEEVAKVPSRNTPVVRRIYTRCHRSIDHHLREQHCSQAKTPPPK